VIDYIQSSLRVDINKAAELSFDFIQCGLCSIRCPAEIVHYHVAQLARRLYGKYIAPRSKHLEKRVKEIEEGKYNNAIKELMKKSLEELRKMYNERDIEPGD
ncbi:MAG: 4Fe-4S ferredoxin, partial [Candidatus Thermoplasmatota archaeon]